MLIVKLNFIIIIIIMAAAAAASTPVKWDLSLIFEDCGSAEDYCSIEKIGAGTFG